MRAEYKRDLNRKYLVMTDYSDGYQTEMLIRNPSKGFATIKKEEWDNETRLFYDITGKQSLEKGFMKRKITYEDLSDLLYSISTQVKECRRLFLDVSGLVLSPEFIYRDLGNERYCWIFYPGENDPGQILELAEYLLEHIDNDNQAVVKTAYELYRRARDGSIDAENLYEILKGDDTCKEEGEEIFAETFQNPENDSASDFGEISKKNKIEKTIDKIFALMKKQGEGKDFETEKENDFESPLPLFSGDSDNGNETVFLNLPEDNTRKLVSRDAGIPDAVLLAFPCVLGSKRESVDILIEDKSVSRMHAQIDEAGGKLYIYDLNSRNGTFINGIRVVSEEKEIKEGDEIRIGNLRFVLA